jgi:hypothetical protein
MASPGKNISIEEEAETPDRFERNPSAPASFRRRGRAVRHAMAVALATPLSRTGTRDGSGRSGRDLESIAVDPDPPRRIRMRSRIRSASAES